jgi:hypothetical protein
MMYGKTFRSMYEGSMYGSGLNVFAVWNYCIAWCDNGVIEVNPVKLAHTLGCEVVEVEDALKVLQAPDPQSRHKEKEGRRLVKEGQFQYRMVAWDDYQKIRNEDERREYNRVKQAQYRARKAGGKPIRGEVEGVAALVAGDVERFDELSEPRAGSVEPDAPTAKQEAGRGLVAPWEQ